MDYRIIKVKNMLKYKGLAYTYNYLWYQILYAHQGFLADLLWNKCFPLFVHSPRLLEIEVTTRCNLRCLICEHTYWNEAPRDMAFNEFKKIVGQLPKLKWIGLTGIGESFINPDFLKMLSYAKSKNIYVELYDPFLLIDERISAELVNLGVDKIFISLDASSAGTYNKIRAGSSFDRVTGNIKRFIELRQKSKAPYPELSFHFIINKINIHEVLDFIDFVKSLTGSESSVIFTRMLHSFQEVSDLRVEIQDSLIEEVKNKSRALGVRVGWNADVPSSKPPISKCSFWIMPFIFATGEVIPCCAGNEANKRDLQKKYSLGNIYKDDFSAIWNSKSYRNLRNLIHKGKVPVQCKDCPAFDTSGKT